MMESSQSDGSDARDSDAEGSSAHGVAAGTPSKPVDLDSDWCVHCLFVGDSGGPGGFRGDSWGGFPGCARGIWGKYKLATLVY